MNFVLSMKGRLGTKTVPLLSGQGGVYDFTGGAGSDTLVPVGLGGPSEEN